MRPLRPRHRQGRGGQAERDKLETMGLAARVEETRRDEEPTSIRPTTALLPVVCGWCAEQVIRQTCLSPHFGMIGQRFPTADEPVRCITAIFAPPGFGCKDLI